MTTAPTPSPAVLMRHPSTGSGALPGWVVALAAEAGVDLRGRPWTLNADADYRSQKALFLLPAAAGAPGLAVKVARDPRFSDRLENEHRSLVTLAAAGVPSVPRAVFRGRHRGLEVVGETALAGVPFSARTDHTASCPWLHRVIAWAHDLGATPSLRGAAEPGAVADALERLLATFDVVCRPDGDVRRLLRDDVDTIGRRSLPTVFLHGDLGTWNVLLDGDDLAVLDWENGDPRGAPLWDLAYLVETHAGRAAVAEGARATPALLADRLTSGPWSDVLDAAVAAQCRALELDEAVAWPLIRLGWAHLATKEATRLAAGRGDRAPHARLLAESARMARTRRLDPQ